MPYVYILKSSKFPKTYVGSTINLDKRLLEHNAGKSKYTSRYTPWELIYKEEFATLQEARKREKYFKGASGRKFLKNLMVEKQLSSGVAQRWRKKQ